MVVALDDVDFVVEEVDFEDVVDDGVEGVDFEDVVDGVEGVVVGEDVGVDGVEVEGVDGQGQSKIWSLHSSEQFT